MPLARMLDSREAVNGDFCAVVRTMGRERLMCKGWGVPRSEVRKVVIVDEGVDEDEGGERVDWRVVRRAVRVERSDGVGCPGFLVSLGVLDMISIYLGINVYGYIYMDIFI